MTSSKIGATLRYLMQLVGCVFSGTKGNPYWLLQDIGRIESLPPPALVLVNRRYHRIGYADYDEIGGESVLISGDSGVTFRSRHEDVDVGDTIFWNVTKNGCTLKQGRKISFEYSYDKVVKQEQRERDQKEEDVEDVS